MRYILPDRIYQLLKWLGLVVIPATATLVGAVGTRGTGRISQPSSPLSPRSARSSARSPASAPQPVSRLKTRNRREKTA